MGSLGQGEGGVTDCDGEFRLTGKLMLHFWGKDLRWR